MDAVRCAEDLAERSGDSFLIASAATWGSIVVLELSADIAAAHLIERLDKLQSHYSNAAPALLALCATVLERTGDPDGDRVAAFVLATPGASGARAAASDLRNPGPLTDAPASLTMPSRSPAPPWRASHPPEGIPRPLRCREERPWPRPQTRDRLDIGPRPAERALGRRAQRPHLAHRTGPSHRPDPARQLRRCASPQGADQGRSRPRASPQDARILSADLPLAVLPIVKYACASGERRASVDRCERSPTDSHLRFARGGQDHTRKAVSRGPGRRAPHEG